MRLDYSTTVLPDSLRTIHGLTINGEAILTTRAKEVLLFGKARITSKFDWKALKEAVRLGEPLQISGGG